MCLFRRVPVCGDTVSHVLLAEPECRDIIIARFGRILTDSLFNRRIKFRAHYPEDTEYVGIGVVLTNGLKKLGIAFNEFRLLLGVVLDIAVVVRSEVDDNNIGYEA